MVERAASDPNLSPVTLSLSDENFGKLVSGKTKAQSLFMSGKLKIKGNVMKGESGSSTLVLVPGADMVPGSHQDGTYPSKGQNSIKTIDTLSFYMTSKYRRFLFHPSISQHSDDRVAVCLSRRGGSLLAPSLHAPSSS